MIRRTLSLLLFVSLAVLLCTWRANAQTTYTQTTHACTMTSCADAQFTPASTLSYYDKAETCGQKNFGLTAIWNGTEYTDGVASINWLGYTYNGHNYYPFGVWELRGTFNNGTITLVEHQADYRGCSGGHNIDGFVTVQ